MDRVTSGLMAPGIAARRGSRIATGVPHATQNFQSGSSSLEHETQAVIS